MSQELTEVLSAILPVLIAALTLVGGGLVYNWQRAIDRKNQILQERRELYRKFVVLVQRMQLDQRMKAEEEAVKNYQAFKLVLAELLVTAPDRVVETFKTLDETASKLMRATFVEKPENDAFGNSPLDEKLRAFTDTYEGAIREMRKDSFDDTKISTSLIAAVLEAATASTLVIKR